MQASTSGRGLSYSKYAVARTSSSRRGCLKVQAVATTAGGKTVLAPPYNVLITGSTKGMHLSIHSGCPCWVTTCSCCSGTRQLVTQTGICCISMHVVLEWSHLVPVQVLEGLWQRIFWKLVTMWSFAAEMVGNSYHSVLECLRGLQLKTAAWAWRSCRLCGSLGSKP